MRKLLQRGDTIVEVLISMTIVSVILGGAFVTTRDSQTGVRNSQEHAEALKLVQSQLEQLRANASVAAPTLFTQPTPFCMYNNTTMLTSIPPGLTDCVQNSSGTPTNAQPAYHLSINRAASNGGYLFTVQATWYEVTGNGQANETMVYRLYP